MGSKCVWIIGASFKTEVRKDCVSFHASEWLCSQSCKIRRVATAAAGPDLKANIEINAAPC